MLPFFLLNDSFVCTHSSSGEFPPRPFGRPPNELAAADDDDAQDNPFINPCRNHTRAKNEYRSDHREKIRSRVAAVSTAASSRIQDAPIQMRATVQTTTRRDVGTNKPARMAA